MDYRYYYENELQVRPDGTGRPSRARRAAALGLAAALALGVGALATHPSIATARAGTTTEAVAVSGGSSGERGAETGTFWYTGPSIGLMPYRGSADPAAGHAR